MMMIADLALYAVLAALGYIAIVHTISSSREGMTGFLVWSFAFILGNAQFHTNCIAETPRGQYFQANATGLVATILAVVSRLVFDKLTGNNLTRTRTFKSKSKSISQVVQALKTAKDWNTGFLLQALVIVLGAAQAQAGWIADTYLNRYWQANVTVFVSIALLGMIGSEVAVYGTATRAFFAGAYKKTVGTVELAFGNLTRAAAVTLKTISPVVLKNARYWKTGARIGFIALVLGTIQVEGGFVAEVRFWRYMQATCTGFVAVVLSSLAGAAFNEDIRTLKTRSHFMEAFLLPEALDWETGAFLLYTVHVLCCVHIHGGLIVESHLERYCQAIAIGLVAILLVDLFVEGLELAVKLAVSTLDRTLKTISPVVQAIKHATSWKTTATCTTLSKYVVVQAIKNATAAGTGTSWKRTTACTTLSKYVESAFKLPATRP
jgi:hypothetical protein